MQVGTGENWLCKHFDLSRRTTAFDCFTTPAARSILLKLRLAYDSNPIAPNISTPTISTMFFRTRQLVITSNLTLDRKPEDSLRS
jgi:hypothetical protein